MQKGGESSGSCVNMTTGGEAIIDVSFKSFNFTWRFSVDSKQAWSTSSMELSIDTALNGGFTNSSEGGLLK